MEFAKAIGGVERLFLRRIILIILLIFTCFRLAEGQAEHTIPAFVRIGLAEGQSSLTLILPAGTAAGTAQGTIWRVETATTLICTMGSDGSIVSGIFSYGPGPVRFDAPGGFLAWGLRRYRGDLVIKRGIKGLSLINEVSVEDYLRGVLPAEISPEWPPAALMAMAMAARTFTIDHLGVHQGEGYDLCSSVHCQVYAGVNLEAGTTNSAVIATEGKVMTYQGRAIAAFYHAASGGHTEDVNAVWGTAPQKYLSGVPDPNEKSPYSQWETILTWPDLQDSVEKKYPQLGRLLSMSILERAGSGRIKTIELTGSLGRIKLGGETFRFLLGLRSSLVDLAVEYGLTPNLNPQDLAGAPIMQTLAPTAEAPWFGIFDAEWNLTPVRLIIEGRGWGHGVGMSQWGAKSLAEQGYTWDMILKYYYQGIEIEDWRSPRASPTVPAPGDAAG